MSSSAPHPTRPNRPNRQKSVDPVTNTLTRTAWPAPPPVTAIREFLLAAALGEAAMVCYFIEAEGLHPDATWGGKPTAVCYAAMKANRRLLDYLLAKGAGVNVTDALGMTPLHYAAMRGCEVCVARLIAAGAGLNAINQAGKTPLALARRGTCQELLVRHGASLGADRPGPRRFH